MLVRGVSDRDDLWKWYQDVTRGKIKLQNATITLRDAQQTDVMAWRISKAYPVAWEGPQLNASTGTEVAFERIDWCIAVSTNKRCRRVNERSLQ